MINCLNPYCSGRWSRTHPSHSNECPSDVLILVVVDDGLVQTILNSNGDYKPRLNPYCSGQWPRTISNLRIYLWVQQS